MKKYELIADSKINWCGRTLFRIKTLISFTTITGETVNAGDLGGYIEKEGNLSHNGNAWVGGDAWVCGDAEVGGDAWVGGDAEVCGNAKVCGNADYICVKGLGSCNRNTTFYKTTDGGVGVVCGCFNGDLDEFVATVKDTHKDTKYAKEYLSAVDINRYMQVHQTKILHRQ